MGQGPLQLWAHHTVIVGHEIPTGFGLPGSCGHGLAGRGGGKRVLDGKQGAPLGRRHVGVQILIHASITTTQPRSDPLVARGRLADPRRAGW